MKRITVATLTLVFLTVFAVAALAQNPMTPQMCTNLSNCSDLLSQMNAALRSGRLTPAEQKEVINNIDNIGRIMKEMSGPGGAELAGKHAKELEETRKRMERIREMQRPLGKPNY